MPNHTGTKGSKIHENQNPFVEKIQSDNDTVVSEVRYKDVFFENIVSQLLKDYIAKIDQEENTTEPISGPCTTDSTIDPLAGPFNKSFSGSVACS